MTRLIQRRRRCLHAMHLSAGVAPKVRGPPASAVQHVSKVPATALMSRLQEAPRLHESFCSGNLSSILLVVATSWRNSFSFIQHWIGNCSHSSPSPKSGFTTSTSPNSTHLSTVQLT
jgi:hypothetical protein